MRPAVAAAEKFFVVIPFTENVLGEPNLVRNLSGCECKQEEGFLGTQTCLGMTKLLSFSADGAGSACLP
jgi:hypothetical protein